MSNPAVWVYIRDHVPKILKTLTIIIAIFVAFNIAVVVINYCFFPLPLR